jgi:plastocyanin
MAIGTTPTPLPTLATDVKEAKKAPPGALDIRLGRGPGFTPDEATVEAGDVIFFLHNPPPEGEFFNRGHNFWIGPEIGQPIASSPVLDPGESIVFTVHGLTRGTYTYWCIFDLHYTHGMVGTLTVR